MNRTLSHLDALLERRNLSGGDRLASLNRSIDSIEQKLGKMGTTQPNQNPAREMDSGANRFEELERRVRELTGGMAGQANLLQSHQANGQPGQNTWATGSESNPLAEIAERKRALNSSVQVPSAHLMQQNARASETSTSNDAGHLAQSVTTEIQELGERIDTLRAELAGELNGIHKSVAQQNHDPASGEDLDRIARGIRDLQQAPQYDPSAFDTLHRDLDELRLSLGSSVRHEEFNNGINDLNVRLDQISENTNRGDSAELSEIKNRLDLINSNTATDNTAVLMSRIESLSQLIGDQSNSNSVDRLEQRLQSLVDSVDLLATNTQTDDSNGKDLHAIEARLDEITRAIVAVSVAEQNQPASDAEAINRLEGQITELAQGVEAVVRRNDDEQFAQLANRIEGLAANLETMGANIQNVAAPETSISSEIETQLRELASRLDMGAVEKHRDDDQLSMLASRIDGLTEKFSSFAIAASSSEAGNPVPVSVIPDTSQLENQLQMLADRLDSAISDNSADNQLQNLELQIADIAAKLGTAGPVEVDLGGVESRLGVIEQNLDANRDLTLEVATKAAQAAVEMTGDQGFSGELINALAEDLRGLQSAANQTESRTIESIDRVQSALITMVDRLGTIENHIKAGSQTGSPAANTIITTAPALPEVDLSIGAKSETIAIDPAGREKISQAPSIDPSEILQDEPVNKVEDNRPLEPGSGAPDIPALVKRASEKLSRSNSVSDLATEKTDFVAAARRAAQAAVSEVQAVKAEVEEQSEPSGLRSKLPNIPRKPIIIAAAAVLMAVMAFAGSKILFSGEGDTAVVAVAPAPIEEQMKSSTEELAADTTGAIPAKTNVRPAVSNTMPASDSMASTANSENLQQTPGIEPKAAETTSSFNAGVPPKQTGSFTAPAKPEPKMAAVESSSMTSDNSAQAPVASGVENITSAPLPPAQLGSTALRQAAATGDTRAQHEIALRYTNGTGVKRNFAEAAKWYERAAAQEFAPAQYRLGSLYEKGKGVKRNLGTAMNWYSRAAEKGNARAMHNLAVISAMGANGEPDMGKALKWFTKAANFGVKDSQFNLGILNGQGLGVKQNLADSYKWFALAAKTGDTDAAKKRDEVANVMDPKALEKSRIIVRDWRPEKLATTANQVTIPEEWRGVAKAQSASLSAGDTIRQTQMMLNKLGYKVGTPDGKFGPKTRKAIVKFQRKSGLSPTGTINAELFKALKGLSI